MVKKNTSIAIDAELWKQAKKKAIDQDIQISEYLENLIRTDLKNSK